MKKKIYIAGKVTGLSVEQYLRKFAEAQSAIEDLGFEAINPIAVVNNSECDWQTAMKKCIAAMMQCDAVFLLENYHKSEGAMIEFNLCLDIGMMYFKDLEQLEKWSNAQPTPLN
jgi:nucleoside 2-deoxyribosyltransferase